MSLHFWAVRFELVQVSIQHSKNFFHGDFRCEVL